MQIGHRAEVGAQVNGVRGQEKHDDAREQPGRTMLSQIAGETTAGRPSHPATYDLHCGHQRIGEQHRPSERVPELRASLGVGRDAAGIVI
jgi:hypothetical protein